MNICTPQKRLQIRLIVLLSISYLSSSQLSALQVLPILQRPRTQTPSILSRQQPKRSINTLIALYCNSDCDKQDPSCYVVQLLTDISVTRIDAINILDTHVLPSADKGYRMNLNSNDQGISNTNTLETNQDSSTYGEFPLNSLDILFDRIDQELNDEMLHSEETTTTKRHRRTLKVVDIGSGCGRLVLYLAMTRPQQQQQQQQCDYTIIGIEQSRSLYDESIRATERLLQYHENQTNDNDRNKLQSAIQGNNTATLTLYCGSAQNYRKEIHSADIVMCYSTAFTGSDFLPSISAVLLSNEWNTILTPPPPPPPLVSSLPSSTSSLPKSKSFLYCITIDKALDPRRGWEMIDRINVPNPEVGMESMAFLQKIKV
jgi:Putative methyltransferase